MILVRFLSEPELIAKIEGFFMQHISVNNLVESEGRSNYIALFCTDLPLLCHDCIILVYTLT